MKSKNKTKKPIKRPMGWICLKCGSVNAPSVKKCDCIRLVRNVGLEVPEGFKDVGPFHIQIQYQDGVEPISNKTFRTFNDAVFECHRLYRLPLGCCQMNNIWNNIGQCYHCPNPENI